MLLSISTKINLFMFVSFLGFPEFQFCLINLTFNVHVYVLPSNTVLMFALNKTDLVFSQCLYNAIWVWSFSEKKILMFVNDTLETTIRKKRKKRELIVNQTCMQMFNCEYNINIHLHLLFFFMLACYILLVLKITLNEIFQCLAFGYSQSFSTKRSFALTDIKPAFMQFNLARLQVRVISYVSIVQNWYL